MKNIKAIAVASEEMLIHKDFDESERERMKHEFAQQCIELAKLEEDKKAKAQEFKEEMAPIQAAAKENLKALRQGFKEIRANVYLVPDHENGMMEYYTEDAVLVSSRRLRPDERQENFLRAIANQ